MNEERRHGTGARREQGAGTKFEERLRELLAEDAYTIRPSPAPYAAVRRRHATERRRRLAVTGAALVTLAAVPVAAYSLTGGGGGADAAAPAPSAGATQRATATPSPSASPSGPAEPATAGQLLDGITYEQAASGLKTCVDNGWAGYPDTSNFPKLGDVTDYRLLLAMKATGDSNAPGDGHLVVAVREEPTPLQVLCTVKDGQGPGLAVTNTAVDVPDAGPVRPDTNGQKLYAQSYLDKGSWKLPFRWGSVGQVDPSVAEVTVSYGGRTSEAVLDDGWFVASGLLTEQVTLAPHIKGYGADGELVYDSDDDQHYQRTLP